MKKNLVQKVSLLLTICIILAMIPIFASAATPLGTTCAMATFLSIAKEVADKLDETGAFPGSVTVSGTEYSFSRADFFGLALDCITKINNGTYSGNITKIGSIALSEALNYNDSFNQVVLSKDAYMETVTRNITWVNSPSYGDGYYANYVGYPVSNSTIPATTDFPSFSGNFSFTRGLYTYARVLRYCKNNTDISTGVISMPTYVDCTMYRALLPYNIAPSALLTLDNIVNAADKALQEYNAQTATRAPRTGTSNFPYSFTVGSATLNRYDYFRACMQAILVIRDGKFSEFSRIPRYTCYQPDGWPDDLIPANEFVKNEYISAVTRIAIFMNNNGNLLPKMVTSFKDGRDLPYTVAMIIFTRVLSYYKYNKELPNYVNHW